MTLTKTSIASFLIIACSSSLVADDWPQWRGPDRDGQWNETGIVREFSSATLRTEWEVEIGAGYSGPTVADERVFVTDRLTEPKQVERVHCFDSRTGHELWSYTYDCPYTISYEAGPRACVTVDDHRAFALGAMGHLHCFDAGTGAVLWQHDLNAEYQIAMPIWGIAAAPLVYEDLVIVQVGGKDDACMVAFDKRDGEEVWRALGDRASYAAPIVVSQAGQDVLVCWTGDSVSGLDPRTGKIYWRFPFAPQKMPIGIATPVYHQGRLFMTSFYDGSLMLELSANSLDVEKQWHRVGRSERDTDALQSIISTPIWIDDHIYGVDSYGELRCLEADSGDRVWEDQTATPKARWSTIHFVRNGDRVWMFNERGELIIGELSPGGFREISRAKLIEPTERQLRQRGGVCWSHPAFADRHVFARNDNKLVCASLEAE